MRRTSLLAVAVILALLPVNLAWGQANLPNNPNAATVQGPDPTGMLGYPLATVPATGALPWPCAIMSFAASLAVTQATSPWVISGAVDQGNPNATLSNRWLAGICAQWERQDNAAGTNIMNFGLAGDTTMGANAGLRSLYTLGQMFGRRTSGEVRALAMTLPENDNVNNPGYVLTAAVPCTYSPRPVPFPFVERVRTVNVWKTAATAAAGNTALWTPAAGLRFRLMRYMVTVTDQATQAAPATLTVSLFDGAAGVTGQVHDTFVPALALVNTGSLYSSGWIDLGNGYLSAAANNVLNINLSAALTAGTVRVICCGTEE